MNIMNDRLKTEKAEDEKKVKKEMKTNPVTRGDVEHPTETRKGFRNKPNRTSLNNLLSSSLQIVSHKLSIPQEVDETTWTSIQIGDIPLVASEGGR